MEWYFPFCQNIILQPWFRGSGTAATAAKLLTGAGSWKDPLSLPQVMKNKMKSWSKPYIKTNI